MPPFFYDTPDKTFHENVMTLVLLLQGLLCIIIVIHFYGLPQYYGTSFAKRIILS
jgi:hypothetical protein